MFLKKTVGFRKATLQLIQGNKRKLIAYRGLNENGINRDELLRPISEDNLILKIMRRKKPFLLPDTAKSKLWQRKPTTRDVLSWAAIPLIFSGHRVGLITLDYPLLGYYSEKILQPVTAFAFLASIIFGNAHFLKDMNRRRDLGILNRIAGDMSGELSTPNLLNKIVMEIGEELECSQCAIFFLDKKTNRLKSEYDSNGSFKEKPRLLPVEDSLAGEVFKSGVPRLLKDARETERFSLPLRVQHKPRAMILAPIKESGQVIGVITADQDIYGWFDEADLNLLELLALQAGIAIKRNKDLEQLQDVGSRLNFAKSMDEILSKIIQTAIQLTHTTSGVIYVMGENGLDIKNKYIYPPRSHHPTPRLENPNSITRQVLRSGKIISFTALDDRVHPDVRETSSSMIAVPITIAHERKTIGVLFLNAKEKHEFTRIEETLLLNLCNQAAAVIFKKQKEDELIALYEVNKKLLNPQDIKTLLETILNSAMSLTNTEFGNIYLLSEDGTHIEEDYNVPEEFKPGSLDISSGGLTREMYINKEPIIVEDTSREERVDAHIRRAGVHAFIGQPLILENHVVGVMYLNDKNSRTFSLSEKILVGTMATNAALAISNTRRQMRYLNTLNHVAGLLNKQENLPDILNVIVKEARSSLDATCCTLFMLDADMNLHSSASDGLDEEYVRNLSFKLGEGLAGWVAGRGISQLVEDAGKDERYLADERTGSEKPRRMLLAPLWKEGKVIGVLSSDRDGGRKFDEADLRFLETLAVQAGISIFQADLRRRRGEALEKRFNPYIAGSPVTNPEWFFGRRKMMQDILDGLTENHFLIHGERRIGKTSLLLQLENQLRSRSSQGEMLFFPVYFSFEWCEEQDFYHELGRRVSRSTQVKEGLNIANPLYEYHDLEDDLTTIITALEKTYAREIRIILLMDEVNKFAGLPQVPNSGYSQLTHNRFRTILVNMPQIKALMTGTSFPEVDSITSPWFNLFIRLSIGEIDEEAARLVLLEPVRGIYTYDEKTMDRLVKMSNCKPFDLQKLAFHTVNEMLERYRNLQPDSDVEYHILESDVDKALEEVLKERDERYWQIWRQMIPQQQELLIKAGMQKAPLNLKSKLGEVFFTQEQLYNISCIREGQAFLTNLYIQWLGQKGLMANG